MKLILLSFFIGVTKCFSRICLKSLSNPSPWVKNRIASRKNCLLLSSFSVFLQHLGRGRFATVEHAIYNGRDVAIKRLIETDSERLNNVFAKEASMLNRIDNDYIIKLLEVSPNPMSIMLEYAIFSFEPFKLKDLKANSLGKLLEIVNTHNFSSKLKLQNKIAHDITSAIRFLHSNNIVHRDIKPKNILVSNQHYINLSGDELAMAFQTCPIKCKIGDLGESRATFAQTYRMQLTKTSFVKRGTAPFMAPEIQVQKYLLSEARIDDPKKIDIWALILQKKR